MVHVSQFVALMIFPRSSSGLKTEPFPFLYELYLLCWCCKLIHSDTIHWNISAVFHLWTYFAFLIVNCSTCIYAPGTHPCSVSYILPTPACENSHQVLGFREDFLGLEKTTLSMVSSDFFRVFCPRCSHDLARCLWLN